MANLKSLAENPIRVTVPASVAFNPQAFKSSVANLMERLGCGKCFSGFDCRFQLHRDYAVDPANTGNVVELPSQIQNHNVVNLSLNKAKAFDIKQIDRVIDDLHKRFGCAPCHSGFDFHFRNEIEEILSA
jgi:hypothetical protein